MKEYQKQQILAKAYATLERSGEMLQKEAHRREVQEYIDAIPTQRFKPRKRKKPVEERAVSHQQQDLECMD